MGKKAKTKKRKWLFEAFWKENIRFVNIVSKIFRFSKLGFDERRKNVSFLFISFLISMISFIGCILMIFLYWDVDELSTLVFFDISFIASIILVIFIALVVFSIYQNLQVFLFLCMSGVIAALSLLHYFSNHRDGMAGILSGSQLPITVAIAGIVLVYGNSINILFWILIVVFNLIVAFFIDVIFNDTFFFFETVKTHQENGKWYRLFSIYLYLYLPHFINLFVFVLIIFIQKMNISATDTVIRRLGDSILSLDFETNDIKTLEAKNFKNLTNTELLFRATIRNLKIYKTFLPSQITQTYLARENHLSSLHSNKTNSTTSSSHTIDSSESDDQEYLLDQGEIMNSRKLIYGLKRSQEVCCMMIDLNILSRFKERGQFESENIHELEKTMVIASDIISSVVTKFGGIVNEIYGGSGFKIFTCFNPPEKNLENATENAIKAAFLIESRISKIILSSRTKIIPKIAVVNIDRMVNGILRTEVLSKFIMIHPKMDLFTQMLNPVSNHLFKKKGNIFVDERTKQDLKMLYFFKQVNIADIDYFGKKKKYDIFRIYQRQKNTDLEDQFEMNNKIWGALRKNKRKIAVEILESYIIKFCNSNVDQDSVFLVNKFNL